MKRYLMIGFAACGLVACGGSQETPLVENTAVVEVNAAKAVRMTLHPTLKLAGILEVIPEETAVIAAPVAGQVRAVHVRENQHVSKGMPMVSLDTHVLASDLHRAEAALQEARANLAMLRRGPLPEEIESMRQEAHGAAVAAKSLADKFAALAPLHDRGEISDVQLEQARAAMQGGEAARAAAAEKLKLLESGTRAEEIEVASARVLAAEADVDAQRLAITLSEITAPIDGDLLELSVRQGMYVDRPDTLGRIANLTSLFARVRVPSSFRTRVSEGARAELRMSESKDVLFEGTVARIAREADQQTGDLDALILLQNKEGALQPGLSCGVEIALPENADAIVVPVAALANRNGDAVVTLIRDDKAFETPVETGMRTEDGVQITRGVAEGDLVAIEGGYALPDACPVNVTLVSL